MTKYIDTANAKTYGNMAPMLDAMRVFSINRSAVNDLIDAMNSAANLNDAAVIASVMVEKLHRINAAPAAARTAIMTAKRRASALWGAAGRQSADRAEETKNAARTADAVAAEMERYLYAIDAHTITARAEKSAAACVDALGMVDLETGETALDWLAAYADTLAEQTPATVDPQPVPVDPQPAESEDTMTPQTPATVDPQPVPVDPRFTHAAEYDAICTTESVAYSVWSIGTVYTRGSGKSATRRDVNGCGIIATPTDILPPLELTQQVIGAESIAAVFGTSDPAAIARAIARAIDRESTAQRSAAELARFARLLGPSFVRVRESHDGTIYTQQPMSAATWAKDVLLPLFAADAAPYLTSRAAVDGERRSMRTRFVAIAEHVSGASFAAQRRHVMSRAEYRAARSALHRALTAARAAAQDAAAALAEQDAAAALAARDAAQVAARAAQDAAAKMNTDKAAQDATEARKAADAAAALAAQATDAAPVVTA